MSQVSTGLLKGSLFNSQTDKSEEEKQVPTPKLIDPLDARQVRASIYDKTLNAFKSIQPVANSKFTLKLANPEYVDPDYYNAAAQKKAILERASLGRRVRGTWQLYDNNTGQMVSQKQATIARVPFLSNSGTFINRGTKYTVDTQQRLSSGSYVRKKKNGELEAYLNALPGQGKTHSYYMEPGKGKFYLSVHQANIPLMPLLRIMGVQDDAIKKAWGTTLYDANRVSDDASALSRYYEQFVPPSKRSKDASNSAKEEAVRNAILATGLNPEVTKRTLGKPYANLSPEAILDITKKIVDVSEGRAKMDERDNLAYQRFMGIDDLMAEWVNRDYGNMRRNLLFKATGKGNLDWVPSGALDDQLKAVLLHSQLGNALEENNPLEILDKRSKVTRMGVGGIGSTDSIPEEARNVQPSQFGLVDPVRTPESTRAGVDLYLASKSMRGEDGKLYAPIKNLRTGREDIMSADQIADSVITFPGELRSGKRHIRGLKDGKFTLVRRNEVTHQIPFMENAVSPLSNLIPLKSTMKSHRAMMGSRMMTQALPLVDAEAPLVQAGVAGQRGGQSYEELYGSHVGAVRAEKPGRVMSVTPDEITIRHEDGETSTIDLHNNSPFNRKTFWHQTAKVAPGQWVEPGALLARSNYTDDNGTVAIGKNFSIGYMPFKGMNYEDAWVISESAAKRLKSEQMYQEGFDYDDKDMIYSRNRFLASHPSKFSKAALSTIDDDGVVKPGTVVKFGDPIVLAVKQKKPDGKIHKKRQVMMQDASQTWSHHDDGLVTDVMKTKRGVNITIKSASEMNVADKLSGRFGDKGIIGAIIPDDQMPIGPDGKPLEILANDNSIISRANPSQLFEAALGRIAAKTGQPYKIEDFENIDDMAEFTINELKKHNIPTMDYVTDPQTGNKIDNIFIGNRYLMKLHHSAESKAQSRGTGRYTALGEPAKGGPEGSKRVGLLDRNALIAHGADEVSREVSLIRGQKNPEIWSAFIQGYTPPVPNTPDTYSKFLDDLRAGGIDVVPDNTGRLNLMAMTDKGVDHLASDREIKVSDAGEFKDKTFVHREGGLFDPKLVGPNQDKWAAIKLHQPLPNPVFEEPIRHLLGLTQKNFDAVMAGKEPYQGFTGPKAIQKALQQIDIDKEMHEARQTIAGTKKTAKDAAIRKLKVLEGAKRNGQTPSDWMMKRVPVLPAKWRPISMMAGSNVPLISDPNFLYSQLVEANNDWKSMDAVSDDVNNEQMAAYKAFKAVTGLGDPSHPKLVEKKVKGVLAGLVGSNPKHSTLQRKLISSTVDMVGRGVVAPDPNLDMDSIGLPEEKAWDAYKIHVARRLRRRGVPVIQALNMIKNRDPSAREMLIEEMDSKPVMMNRAPVWHKYGILAFKPKLVKGDVIRVSPLVVTGLGMDFDGDTAQYHVFPDDKAASQAAEKMLPSKNLFAAADFKTPMYLPGKEYALGLYAATADKPAVTNKTVKSFANRAQVLAAIHRGDISPTDPVNVLHED